MTFKGFRILAAAASLAVLTPGASSANVLVNGDFDFGAAFPWVTVWDGGGWIGAPEIMTSAQISTSAWFPDNAAAHSGGFALARSYGGNFNGGNQGAYQTFNTGASAANPLTLNISGYVAGGVSNLTHPGAVAWWEVRLIEGNWQGNSSFDAGTLVWKKEIKTGDTPPLFGWDLAAGSVDVTSPTATLLLKYGVWDDWRWDTYGAFFDTFSVEVVPEPASMLVLTTGISGLLAVSRRRIK